MADKKDVIEMDKYKRGVHDEIGKLCPKCTTVFAGCRVDLKFRFCPYCGTKVHDVRVVS